MKNNGREGDALPAVFFSLASRYFTVSVTMLLYL